MKLKMITGLAALSAMLFAENQANAQVIVYPSRTIPYIYNPRPVVPITYTTPVYYSTPYYAYPSHQYRYSYGPSFRYSNFNGNTRFSFGYSPNFGFYGNYRRFR